MVCVKDIEKLGCIFNISELYIRVGSCSSRRALKRSLFHRSFYETMLPHQRDISCLPCCSLPIRTALYQVCRPRGHRELLVGKVMVATQCVQAKMMSVWPQNMANHIEPVLRSVGMRCLLQEAPQQSATLLHRTVLLARHRGREPVCRSHKPKEARGIVQRTSVEQAAHRGRLLHQVVADCCKTLCHVGLKG